MLRVRFPFWLLAIAGLLVLGGLAGLLVTLQKPSMASLQIGEVTVSKEADGSARLLVTGQGLREELEALLIPDRQALPSAENKEEVQVPLFHVASNGQLAIATSRDQRLLALDVTAGRPVKILGGTTLSPPSAKNITYPVSATALVGSRAIIGRVDGGLILADVANPKLPREIDRIDFVGGFPDMESVNGRVYVASHTEGLLVVTIEGDRLRSRRVAGHPFVWRIAADDRRLVVADQKGGLALYELDGKGWPRLVGNMPLAIEIRDLALSPKALYVGTAEGQLLEFSLERWPKPVFSARCDLFGKPLRLAWSKSAGRLFCSLISRGVAVVDVSCPGVPALAGLIAMPRMPTSLQVCNDRLMTVGMDGLKIFPADTLAIVPPSAEIVPPFTPVRGKLRLCLWGDAVVVHDLVNLAVLPADYGATGGPSHDEHQRQMPFLALPDTSGVRLHALDDGMPSARIVGHIRITAGDLPDISDHISPIKDAFWQAGHLLVLTYSSLQVFDGSSDGKASLVGEYRLPTEPSAMAWLEPGFVVVALRGKGLQVIDVRNPAVPKLAGESVWPAHLRVVGLCYDLLVDGQRLFVARSRLGVEVFDLSDPATPTLVQRIDTPGSAGRMSLDNGLLMVTDQDRGLYMIDVRGSFGVPVGSYPLPIIANEILSRGGKLFMTDAAGGILQLPAPRRLVPAKAARSRDLAWALPGEVAPGRYTLMVYGIEGATSFPVVLQ
jgi:hypothetical protein